MHDLEVLLLHFRLHGVIWIDDIKRSVRFTLHRRLLLCTSLRSQVRHINLRFPQARKRLLLSLRLEPVVEAHGEIVLDVLLETLAVFAVGFELT